MSGVLPRGVRSSRCAISTRHVDVRRNSRASIGEQPLRVVAGKLLVGQYEDASLVEIFLHELEPEHVADFIGHASDAGDAHRLRAHQQFLLTAKDAFERAQTQ